MGLANIVHSFKCEPCDKKLKLVLDSDEDWREKKLVCPHCLGKLKYKGGTDARVTSFGNCGYVSYEKVGESNWRNLSPEQKALHEHSSVTVNRAKNDEEMNKKRFWKQFLPDPNKPLDLSTIKDTEKFIQTGEIS